jgi:uncharacterized protein with GYD domain
MPTFVLMTKLRPEMLHDATERKKLGKKWYRKVRKSCPDVKWQAHFAILGPFDFMDIYDAPDVETAHKVSLISRSEGALSAESWQALPYEQFIKQLEQIAP